MISILLALSTAPRAHAADACAAFDVQADKFGAGTNVTANVQGLSQFTAIGITLEVKTGQAELTLTAKTGGAVSAKVAAGAELPFRFGDGTVKTLVTNRDSAMTSYVGQDQVMTLVPYAIGLDAATLTLMAAQPVTAIRFPLPSGPYDWDANKGVQKKLMAAAACAQQYAAK